jgi:hypothetical protein
VRTMMELELETKTELGAPVKRETVTTRVTEEINNDGRDNEPESIDQQEELRYHKNASSNRLQEWYYKRIP